MIKKIDDEEFRMMTGSIRRRLSPFPTTLHWLWNSDFQQGLMFFIGVKCRSYFCRAYLEKTSPEALIEV